MTKQAMAGAERQRKYRESRVTLKVENAGVAFLMEVAIGKELKGLAELAKMEGEGIGQLLETMKALKAAADELGAHGRKLMALKAEQEEAELARLNRELAGDCEVDSVMGRD